MNYIVRPPQAPTPNPTTLIVMHGYGADEHDLVPIAEQLDPRLLIISLQAPIQLGSGGKAWYHLIQLESGLAPDDYSRHESEEMLVHELTPIIRAEGGDPSKVILMGFSQGAAMTYSLISTYNLAQYGLQVHAIIVMSGYLPRDILPLIMERQFAGLPVFISHGEFDELIPWQAMPEAEKLLSQQGAVVQSKMYSCGHGVLPETVEDIRNWFATLDLL
ncbi:MAG: dienelactone hydrolase family protein [Bacteroidota bacterium]|nr:dienelactone hydrolase family protein [Bacteroidota bacterium]MDP4233500.1 dienelactone hydrolase family protein [Bacteroidota bacterium]MDP4243377.1 dienelactone hydrolase family protein [Bacteroidota bacterium]MDP4287936.1 dienelactone hydrolase family protein [Bacteroidota bacterium]